MLIKHKREPADSKVCRFFYCLAVLARFAVLCLQRKSRNELQFAPAEDRLQGIERKVGDFVSDLGSSVREEGTDRVLDLRGLLNDAVARIDPLNDLMDRRFDAGRDRMVFRRVDGLFTRTNTAGGK